MEFRTKITLPPSPLQLSYQQPSLLIGSCFTQNIGQSLQQFKLPVSLNPFGILYNPASIAQALELIAQKKVFEAQDLLFFNEKWLSLQHHGYFSHNDPDTCLQQINTALLQAHEFIKTSASLIITLGTAYVYTWKENGQVVANCHKIPSQKFERERMTVYKVRERLSEAIAQIRLLQPKLQILFTISPIRHWKDGAIENQRSKATLLLAVDELCRAHDYLHYFPAYEIMMDDLRDYRFYEEDMIHPNSTAIQYIQELFQTVHMTDGTRRIMKKVWPIVQAAKHRPVNPNSTAHQRFCEQQLKKIEGLEREFGFLDFAKERGCFEVMKL